MYPIISIYKNICYKNTWSHHMTHMTTVTQAPHRFTYHIYFKIATGIAEGRAGTMAAPTLVMALETFLRRLLGIMILGAFILTLFPSLVLHTSLADLLMKSVACADATPRVTLPTNSLACQRFEFPLLLRTYPLIIVTIWTRLILP
jgi:hypothetical protein